MDVDYSVEDGIEFSRVPVGKVFVYDGLAYQKLSDVQVKYETTMLDVNCVRLGDGQLKKLSKTVLVKHYPDACVILKRKD